MQGGECEDWGMKDCRQCCVDRAKFLTLLEVQAIHDRFGDKKGSERAGRRLDEHLIRLLTHLSRDHSDDYLAQVYGAPGQEARKRVNDTLADLKNLLGL